MAVQLERTLAYLTRACDLVFGPSGGAFALFATVQLILGNAHVGIVIALWLMLLINGVWSNVTKGDSIRANLLRGFACFPLTSYIYVAEPSGVLEQMWMPAAMMCIGVCLMVCVGTQKRRAGFALSFVYGTSMIVASWVAGALQPTVFAHALGIGMIGTIVTIVSAYLGRTLEKLSRRTDELTVAITGLGDEMQRRQRVESELAHAQKLESVGRLAAGIAHEINTPVQFVNDSLSFVRDAVTDLFQLVEREVDPKSAEAADVPYLAEEVPQALARAADGLGRVSTIVRSMNQFAHPDAEEMQDVDLDQAITATLVVARNEYKYVADLETDLGDLPLVRCYAGALNQAVLNIVVNAAHAIRDVVGNSGARGTIRVTTRSTASSAVITISDTGTGIPAEIHDRIFEPFFTTKDIGRGTGQGLALAHSVVVDRHRGKLSLDSEVGKGSTFTIEVPLAGTLACAA